MCLWSSQLHETRKSNSVQQLEFLHFISLQKSQMCQLTENNLQKKDSDVVSLMVARDTAEQRAEATELKVFLG